MLATIIILAIVAVIAVIIFAVKAANLSHQIEDIYAKQAILHDKYCVHEDIINANYKSLAELNRRQDEWQRQHNENDKAMRADIKALQDYNAEQERKAREAVEEFKETMQRVAEMARKRAKKAAQAKAQAPEQPATDPRETRDTKQTPQANRERFAELRKTMGVKQAREAMDIGKSTATRYEHWRKEQRQ